MDEAAKGFVVSTLARWGAAAPAGGILPQHRLIRDLHMDGDDLGMSVVLEINKHFGIKPRRQEWETLETVGELLDLVARHVDALPSSAE